MARLGAAVQEGISDASLVASTVAADASWAERANRKGGPSGYQFGDISRTIGHAATQLTTAAHRKWQTERYNINPASSAGEEAVDPQEAGPSSTPAANQVLGTVARSAGMVLGAGKGLVISGTVGVVKGAVAAVDKVCDALRSSSRSRVAVVAAEQQQQP